MNPELGNTLVIVAWTGLIGVFSTLFGSILGIREKTSRGAKGPRARAEEGVQYWEDASRAQKLTIVLNSLLFIGFILAVLAFGRDFTLTDQHGRPVTLSDLGGRNAVLVFYRGHW